VPSGRWQDEAGYPNTVTVHLNALRRKIDADHNRKIDADHKVKLIHTVHGLGYTLRRPETENAA
jgi:DNA-binding response OmpR family regulator